MANFFTEFSFAIYNITVQEAEWLKSELRDRRNRQMPEFEISTDADGTVLWIHEDTGCDLEELANLLQQFLFRFRPTSSIGFSWADTCSEPRLDSFGGGAVFVTAKGQEWVNAWTWLSERGIE